MVMKNNIFTFNDTYWIQNEGTAMGTPTACSYATITYGQHENVKVLPHFQQNLLYFRRYIDDIFGIWIPTSSSDWETFKTTLNQFGSLRWIVNDLSDTVNFLDLSLSITGSTITAATYQKPMNLHLYIPPSSAHPPSCFKGLIYGEMFRYKRQNNATNFVAILASFIERLLRRGHTLENLFPIFQDAASYIDSKPNQLKVTNHNLSDSPNRLFFFWKFHPKGIQHATIRQLFNDSFQESLLPVFNQLTLAISRPKNLRDLLTKTDLKLPAGRQVSSFIKNDL
jgi:hypothetical protein